MIIIKSFKNTFKSIREKNSTKPPKTQRPIFLQIEFQKSGTLRIYVSRGLLQIQAMACPFAEVSKQLKQ